MKERFIILGLLLLATTSLYAQKLKPNATIKAHSISFSTEQHSAGEMKVYNSKNLYHDKMPVNKIPNATIEMKDKAELLHAFRSTFSNERLNELLSEKYILMHFFVNTSGQITEIEFTLDKNTTVTALELENLEKAIKADVTFKFWPENAKGDDLLQWVCIARYNSILNGSPN